MSYPIIAECNDVYQWKLEELSALKLHAIMSVGRFETDLGEPLTKPVYFFGDLINEDDNFCFGDKKDGFPRLMMHTSFFQEY